MNNGTTSTKAPATPAQENGAGTGLKKPQRRTAKERAEDQLTRAGVDPKGMTYVAMRSKLKQLKADGKLDDARAGNGKPPKAEVLEARGMTIMIDRHSQEEVEVTITDKRTGMTTTVKKPRVLVALEKLYQKATSKDGDTQALDKWLDRALGRPAQAVALKHSGEMGVYTAKRPTKAALAAKKAYADALRGGE